MNNFPYTRLTVNGETQVLFCFGTNCPLLSTDCNKLEVVSIEGNAYRLPMVFKKTQFTCLYMIFRSQLL